MQEDAHLKANMQKHNACTFIFAHIQIGVEGLRFEVWGCMVH